MKNQLQLNFENQLKQLELKMEMNANQLFQDFGQCFQVVMDKIEELVLDHMELKAMIEDKLFHILQAINSKQARNITPTTGNTPHHPHKVLCTMPSPDPNMTPMHINHIQQADGSLINNPTASHANHNNDGSIALAGAST